MLHRGLRPLHDLLVQFPIGVTRRLHHQLEFTGGLAVRTELLDANGLLVSEMRARGEIFVFLLRKAADDLGLRERRRSGRLRLVAEADDMVVGRRSNRSLRRVLREER